MDLLLIFAGFIIAMLAFLNLQWNEIQVRWDRYRAARGDPVHVEFDTVIRAAEHQRIARLTRRERLLALAKRAFSFLMLVLIVSPIAGQVLPYGPVATAVFAVTAALVGTIIAMTTALISELRSKRDS